LLLTRVRAASCDKASAIRARSAGSATAVKQLPTFPRGRNQLIEEAVDRAAGSVQEIIAAAGDVTPAEVFEVFVKAWRDGLVASDFRSGCPVLAGAIESSDETPELVDAAGRALTSWRSALAALLRRHGVTPAQARRLSNLVVAAVEGAVVLSRADRDVQPVDDVHRAVRALLDTAVSDR